MAVPEQQLDEPMNGGGFINVGATTSEVAPGECQMAFVCLPGAQEKGKDAFSHVLKAV